MLKPSPIIPDENEPMVRGCNHQPGQYFRQSNYLTGSVNDDILKSNNLEENFNPGHSYQRISLESILIRGKKENCAR